MQPSMGNSHPAQDAAIALSRTARAGRVLDLKRDGVFEGEMKVGLVLDANALVPATWPQRLLIDGLSPSVALGACCVVVRSGWNDGPDASPLWLAAPRGQWMQFADHVGSLCGAAGVVAVLVPRASDVVSDAPSALSFLRSNPAWRVLCDPCALLTATMLDDAPEHLERLGELLLAHHACVGVVLSPAMQSWPAAAQRVLTEQAARAGSARWQRS